MPTLGGPLDFAKYEGRNLRAHNLSSAPASPVTGQFWYDNSVSPGTLNWWDGSVWQAAKGSGTAPDATTGSKGIVQLAGDLAGTAASPQIATGVIVDADVNSGAAIAETKLSLASDAVAGTASRRTLGTGAQQAFPGSGRLDQVAAPTGSVSLNSQLITNLATPASATDAANKQYVDGVSAGLDAKGSVHAATTANIASLAGGAPNALDGVTLAVNDRVLVKDQTTTNLNGIYVVTTLGTGANGTWARATDMDTWLEVPGAYTWVEQGTLYGDSGWVCTADQGGTLNTTAITWTQFTGTYQIVDGAALLKTGNTLDVVTDNTTLEIASDQVRVKDLGITNAKIAATTIDLTTKVTGALPLGNGGTGQTTAKAARETGLAAVGYYSSATHGAGATITITQATHGLRASRGIVVQVQNESDGAVEFPDIAVGATGDVTVTYGASLTANSKRVTLTG